MSAIVGFTMFAAVHAVSSTCSFMTNVNMANNNIAHGAASSHEDCCNFCSRIDGVTHGSYCGAALPGHCAAGTCWCKSGQGSLSVAHGVTSFTIARVDHADNVTAPTFGNAVADTQASDISLDVNTEKKAFADIVKRINSLNTTWTAAHPKFVNLEEVVARCGTVLEHEDGYQVPEDFHVNDADASNTELPSDFDVREQWPQCAGVSGHIRDQSACGSCWAHGSTEALNDRLCIATGSTNLLSTEDTTANCNALSLCFSFGCGGGQPAFVWQWFKRVGVVTGGDYADRGEGTSCAPYSLPSCQHHGWVPPTPEHPSCPSKEYATPSPFHSCSESGYQTSFAQDKVKTSSAYGLRGEKNIQNDIMTFGSVTAAFTVYEDFPSYKSGVYQHHSGKALGGHAVKMMGWGLENGTPYWLIANSWNEDWGNKGFFKILRGSNHCGIEGQITAGHAGSVLV